MAVFERGYRPYKGELLAARPGLVIAGEAYRTAVASVAFKRIRILFLVWFVMIAFFLYLQVGSEVSIFVRGRLRAQLGEAEIVPFILKSALAVFYKGVVILTALLSILVGAGLVADDLGSRSLQLYLVRPLRPRDYVLGKALVIPLVLLWMALLPGVAFYLLVGFWQEPGETWPFLRDHLDILAPVLEHYLLASASYTGIVLFLSSRSPRRVAVAVVAAAVVLGGVLLRMISFGTRMRGTGGDILRLSSIPSNTEAPFQRMVWPERWPRGLGYLPDREAIWALALALLLLGLVATWRRARSVEVTG